MNAADIEKIARAWHRMLEPYTGRKYLGVVESGDCIEIVFDDPEGDGDNLLSLWLEDGEPIRYCHGFVAEPEIYIKGCGVAAVDA